MNRRAAFDFTARKRPFHQPEEMTQPASAAPIVRTHPKAERKCLYVMRDDCTGIGDRRPEALICALADHIVKPQPSTGTSGGRATC